MSQSYNGSKIPHSGAISASTPLQMHQNTSYLSQYNESMSMQSINMLRSAVLLLVFCLLTNGRAAEADREADFLTKLNTALKSSLSEKLTQGILEGDVFHRIVC